MKRLCEDDTVNIKSMRKSQGSFRGQIKSGSFVTQPHVTFNTNTSVGLSSNNSASTRPSNNLVSSERNMSQMMSVQSQSLPSQPNFLKPRLSEDLQNKRLQQQSLSPSAYPRANIPQPIPVRETLPVHVPEPKSDPPVNIHSGCVPFAQHEELQTKYRKWLKENKNLIDQIHILEAQAK